jgi:hypothetical protein
MKKTIFMHTLLVVYTFCIQGMDKSIIFTIPNITEDKRNHFFNSFIAPHSPELFFDPSVGSYRYCYFNIDGSAIPEPSDSGTRKSEEYSFYMKHTKYSNSRVSAITLPTPIDKGVTCITGHENGNIVVSYKDCSEKGTIPFEHTGPITSLYTVQNILVATTAKQIVFFKEYWKRDKQVITKIINGPSNDDTIVGIIRHRGCMVVIQTDKNEFWGAVPYSWEDCESILCGKPLTQPTLLSKIMHEHNKSEQLFLADRKI